MRAYRAMIAVLLLAGCSPLPFKILATIQGKDLVFSSKGKGSWPFRKKDNIETAREIEVRDGEQLVWRIEQALDSPGCANPEPLHFPLTYNRTPRCYRVIMPSRGIQHGIVYTVESDGSTGVGRGWGQFRIQDSAQNL